ncbi:MAG: NAD-dependent epimerase/dehydratase family protein, partial [Fuerstiella sp.]|nr:NAD-dependent epimerase/dehydratase family protein [Fuerstiella sp.]
MNILIIGGGGMIGQKLAVRLAEDGRLGEREISELTLFDVVSPAAPEDATSPVKLRTGDLSNADEAKALVAEQPDIIFHLAAIVSGEAEEDFPKGYRINLDGTRHLLDAVCAIEEYVPRVVFTSSIAVFGAPCPDAISD